MATSPLLGTTVHDAAQRTAEMLGVLLEPLLEPLTETTAAERLTTVLRAYGEPDSVQVSAADLPGLRAAAAKLRVVFAAVDVGEAAARLNRLLAEHAQLPRLTDHGGTFGWHLHVDSCDDAPWPEWFLTSSCLALSVLLAERQAPPAGLCESPSCGKPFVNVGRGSPRRYCSDRCATRERVAAYRESRRA
jgi:predicted RNA-binding Zn ribbon-like protein